MELVSIHFQAEPNLPLVTSSNEGIQSEDEISREIQRRTTENEKRYKSLVM